MTRPPPAHVLVVEDDVALAAMIQEELQEAGFQVTVAHAGDAAIARIESSRVDVGLIDKELPGTNGLDLVEYLHRRFPRLPIILMTAFGGDLVAHAARERGAAMYLEKPVRLSTLRSAVAAALTACHAPAPPAPERAPDEAIRAREGPGTLWAVISVRPAAARLQSLIRRLLPGGPGAEPASPSLLRQAIGRIGPMVPSERIVVVAGRRHEREVTAELGEGGARLLIEPAERGCAAGSLFPLHWIAHRDPGATVVLLPHDHHVVGDARRMLAHLRQAVAFVSAEPRRLVILGVPPAAPEPDHGWILPGASVDGTAGGIRSVVRFVENPTPEEAHGLMAAGALWSTAVIVARAAAVVDLGRQLLSPLHAVLSRAVDREGSAEAAHALRRAYRLTPPGSLAARIFQHSESALAVLPVEDVGWADWGAPGRALSTLRQLGMTPPGQPRRPRAGAERPDGPESPHGTLAP